MELPVNLFKRRLAGDEVQYGLFVGLADPVAAEVAAGAGFDWLMLDGEHGPNDLRTLLIQLQATAASATSVLVRPASADAVLVKRILDLGAQTLLIPMVDSVAIAEEMAAAVRYPPRGVRGVGTALARAARWNRIPDYLQRAEEEIALVVQVESAAALDRLEAIAEVDGVDAVFVGPSDLAASLGHLGRPGHPDVQAAVVGAVRRVRATGTPVGVYAPDPDTARTCIEAGAGFVAVGVDLTLLAQATDHLASRFGLPATTTDPAGPPPGSPG